MTILPAHDRRLDVVTSVKETSNDYIRHVRTFTAFLALAGRPRPRILPFSAASDPDRRACAEHQRLGCGAALLLHCG